MTLGINLDLAARATKLLQWGIAPSLALKELGPGDPDSRDALRLAELRIKAQGKFRRASEMVFDEVGLETATPEEIARYRATRLKAAHALDLTCGVGGDTIALAEACDRVTAVDEDPDKLWMAEHNCHAYGYENVTFVRGEALVQATKVKADVVFADPLRRKDERRVAALQETLPDTTRLIKKLAAKRFAVEVSSRLAPADLRFEEKVEREWVGLGPEANCCTLYFGDLAQCDTSVVVLAARSRLERPFAAETRAPPAPKAAQEHLFEVHEAVMRAGMEGELASSLDAGVGMWGDAFFTANEAVKSPFFVARYEVLDRAPLHDPDLVKALKKWGAGKALLRWPMPPTDHVRKTRALQQRLTGSETITVFDESGQALLCRFA